LRTYKVLLQQKFSSGEFSLVPIRSGDRYDIMKWRNQQMYHLRQSAPLTVEDQNYYFDNVVSELFDKEQPDQLLFSFLQNDVCIGYGGLVHINWIDKNAEISFIMDTSLEEYLFQKHWTSYLKLIEKLAFEDMNFHKLFVYAFDLRPHLYKMLKSNSYFLDGVLTEHCFYEGKYVDVVIHSKLKVL
jgi:RimJ/RimL family protein N-acetyltransferase